MHPSCSSVFTNDDDAAEPDNFYQFESDDSQAATAFDPDDVSASAICPDETSSAEPTVEATGAATSYTASDVPTPTRNKISVSSFLSSFLPSFFLSLFSAFSSSSRYPQHS
jgi:hypothetical protein